MVLVRMDRQDGETVPAKLRSMPSIALAGRLWSERLVEQVMASNAMFAEVAAVAGDPARAAMLHALMDGRALTAAELARVAGILPPTASGHLRRMTTLGILSVVSRGGTATTGSRRPRSRGCSRASSRWRPSWRPTGCG